MIKKVERDYDNNFGIEKLDDSYTFDKPYILTLVPNNCNNKNMNGYFSLLANLMQIRSSHTDSDYTIGNMPFDILSNEYRENFAEKIIENIPIGNVSEAKKYMNNINIFSYCAANKVTADLLYKIHDYLEKNNYSQDEIKEIMKEIFVLQIIDNYTVIVDNEKKVTPIPFATTVIVQDVHDGANLHFIDFHSDNPFISTRQFRGVTYMLYNSFGEGSLYEKYREHELKNDYALAPIVNTVISLYLIKAISISINGNSKKDITIYNELQKIIKIAQEYINNLNKSPDELTLKEKEELNKLLFKEIKEILHENIPAERITDDDKKYLMEKDKGIAAISFLNPCNVFSRFNSCIEIINKIISTYNNHLYGEIVGTRSSNISNRTFSVTREEEIDSRLKDLEREFDDIHRLIDEIKYPDDISPGIKAEYQRKLSLTLEELKNIINSQEFQKIINEVVKRDTIFKNR